MRPGCLRQTSVISTGHDKAAGETPTALFTTGQAACCRSTPCFTQTIRASLAAVIDITQHAHVSMHLIPLPQPALVAQERLVRPISCSSTCTHPAGDTSPCGK